MIGKDRAMRLGQTLDLGMAKTNRQSKRRIMVDGDKERPLIGGAHAR